MKENKFSVVIPAYNCEKTILRAIKSVENQNYPLENIELIIIDDGSMDKTQQLLETYETRIKKSNVIIFEQNKGRLAARNVGMEEALHEWICWLDSDDEYVSTYFSTLNEAINQNPDYKIFNFGAVAFDEQNFRSWVRNAFMPGVRADGRGHDVFKSGGIGSGSFIFKAKLLDEVGFLPEAATPYGDGASLPALATIRWPHLRDLYGQNEFGDWLPFGNPWGDDFLMFYILTRNNLSKPLEIALYLQHVRHG